MVVASRGEGLPPRDEAGDMLAVRGCPSARHDQRSSQAASRGVGIGYGAGAPTTAPERAPSADAAQE